MKMSGTTTRTNPAAWPPSAISPACVTLNRRVSLSGLTTRALVSSSSRPLNKRSRTRFENALRASEPARLIVSCV